MTGPAGPLDDPVIDRQRLAKVAALLSSDKEGEQLAALAALHGALKRAGLAWNWVCDLIERGQLPNNGREQLLSKLVTERLKAGLVHAWAATGTESAEIRDLLATATKGDLSAVSIDELSRVIALADQLSRRARP
jgi:hypothetical protein